MAVADLIAMQAGVLAVLTFTILLYHQGLADIESRISAMRAADAPQGTSEERVQRYRAKVFPRKQPGLSWRGVLTYFVLAAVALVDLALWVVAAIQIPWNVDFEPAWLNPRAGGIAGAAFTFLLALTLLIAVFGVVRIRAIHKLIWEDPPIVESARAEADPVDPRIEGPRVIDSKGPLLNRSRRQEEAARTEDGEASVVESGDARPDGVDLEATVKGIRDPEGHTVPLASVGEATPPEG